MSDPASGPTEQPHYFSPAPAGDAARTSVRVRLPVLGECEVLTAPGVFSTERLDLGTRVLLDRAQAPPATGDLLDLGCGWGPIALSMAALSPGATVWAVDVNERARDLTAENARRLGLTGVRAVAPDDVPAGASFAAVWSNPPIRVGKDALHALLLRWLPRLAPGAAADLVVQKNLGADSLQRWLGDQGLTATREASAKGYRVLRVRAATSP